MTNAEYIARELALSVLRAYHREIKSGFVSDASAVERERGQAAAFKSAEIFLRKEIKNCCSYEWLDERSEKQ